MSSPAPSSAPGQRTGWRPFVLLTLTDLAAVATLARCFSGPGELAVALPTCLLAHLVFGASRRLRKSPEHRGLVVTGSFLLGALVSLLLPLALVERSVLPLFALGGWHLVHGQLSAALAIFSNKVAPVVEAPGLVLVTGWAGGAVGLGSEVLYADSGLPAVLALVPAFDVVVFTGTLGTSSGRALEVALIAALALSFLVISQGDRRPRQRVLMARSEAAPARPAKLSGGLFVPGLAVVAAVAAGVVGPLIPGAGSTALLSWHGGRAGPGGAGGGVVANGTRPGEAPNKIAVSDLVQVAEQEVRNQDSLLFTVRSRLRTKEVLLTLDHFNGVAWSQPKRARSSFPVADAGLAPPSSLQRHLPAVAVQADGTRQLTQVIDIAALGGSYLPTPGVTSAVSGEGPVREPSRSGPLRAPALLAAGLTYGVSATLPPASGTVIESQSPFGLESSPPPPGELQLPRPAPPRLVSLARRIVAGRQGEYASAVALQDYFLSGHGFSYKLPTVTPRGAIADTSQSYRALESFLFSSRVGYCQQYATAFAVLARLDGIPTRIALGFLPGPEIGLDEFEVTGLQVHAWPQVWFPYYGWVNFEPTPGTSSSSSSGPTAPGTSVPSATTPVHPLAHPAHNLHRLTGSKGPVPLRLRAVLPANRLGQSGLSYLLYVIAFFALAWALSVPSLRLALERRRRRNPERATLAAWQAATAALALAGAHRRRTETNLEFAERVRRTGLLGEAGYASLRRLAILVDARLYGRPPAAGPPGREAAAAWQEATAVRRAARRQVGRLRLLADLLDPRAVLSS